MRHPEDPPNDNSNLSVQDQDPKKHTSLPIMINKDGSHAGDQLEAFTNRSCASHDHIKRAIPDSLGFVHEERIPLSTKFKDPDFRAELDAKIDFCVNRERFISPETKLNYLIMHGWYTLEEPTKQSAYEQEMLEKESGRKNKGLGEEIERLKGRRQELRRMLVDMREIMGNRVKIGDHEKRADELFFGFFGESKKPLEKEQEISLLNEIVWELEAEVDDVIGKLHERLVELMDMLPRWSSSYRYHGEKASELLSNLLILPKYSGKKKQLSQLSEMVRYPGKPLRQKEHFLQLAEIVRYFEAEVE